ncbi:uncharacterized protein ZBIST_2050 [Zygosaccharomyces bailii]|nr:uncharacterized protein ZBIST_2050 [Zygosaccharomyces bailii]
MPQVVYVVSRGSSNVNGYWLNSFLHSNNKGLRYITYGVLTVLSIYVLAPSVTYLIFGENMFSSGSKRSDKTTTGLINNRNDCFANSSVQALSALPKLTLYLNDILKQATQVAKDLKGDDVGPREEPNQPGSAESRQTATANNGPGLSQKQIETLATPKAELEQNPLDMHMANMSINRPGLSALKSNATLTTLKDNDNGGDETPEMSLHLADESGDTPVDDSRLPKLPMHRSLASMLEQLQRTITSTRYLSIWPLLHCLEVIFNARISSGQNDAHELTQVILETLQKENIKLREFVNNHNISMRIPEIPFRGKTADHLVCTACRNSSKVKTHQFIMYPLTVPQALQSKLADMVSDNQTETIEGYSCLTCKVSKILENERGRDTSKYPVTEQNILKSLSNALPNMLINDDVSEDLHNYIDGYDKDGCAVGKLKSTIVKKTVVVEAPPILLIHLSRSIFNGATYSRNSCAVNFDEILQLQEQVIENNRCVGINTVAYRLKAIVKHSGSHSQGHYQCYRHKPDFVKDIDTHAVINRTPVIDASLVNIQDPQASKEMAATEMMEPPSRQLGDSHTNLSSTSLSNSSTSPRVDNPENPEDRTFDQGDSAKMSRKPSAIKKITNFLSGKTSLGNQSSDNTETSDSETGGRGRKLTASRSVEGNSRNPSSIRKSSSRSRNPSAIRTSENMSRTSSSTSRSRASSVSSFHRNRSRANSISSDRTPSDFSETTSSEENLGTTASETDDNSADPTARKRHLKKIKSVTKYPYWLISDTAVHEAKPQEVLNETKYVYMLFYERFETA